MTPKETAYINNAQVVVAQNLGTIDTIDTLYELIKPTANECTVNTQVLLEAIDNLEYERKDGKLDGNIEDYDEAELEIASKNLEMITRVLSDIEKGNWYTKSYVAELAYSRLLDDEYDYKLVFQDMSAGSSEDAEIESEDIRMKAPKQHPEDDTYALEDVRIREQITDQDGKLVVSRL